MANLKEFSKALSKLKPKRKLQETDLTTETSFLYNWMQDLSNSRPFTIEELYEIYRSISWVNIGVRKVAIDLAALPYKIVKSTNNGEVDVTKDYPLFKNFNSSMSRSEFIEQIYTYYKITGAIYCELKPVPFKRENGLQVGAIYPIPTDKLKIAQGSYDLDHYLIKNDFGDWIKIKKELVISQKYFDPSNPLKPSSPLNAVRSEIRSLQKAWEYNIKFFDNYANTPVAFKMKEMILDPDEFRRNVRLIREMHAGTHRSGKAAILNGDMDIENLGFNPVESAFLETMEKNMETIMSTLGVPSSLVNSKNVNRSNMTEALKMYWESRLLEAVQLDQMFSSILPEGVRYVTVFDHIPSLQKDNIKHTNQISKQWNDNIITLNEYREKLGYQAVPDGAKYKFEIEMENGLIQDVNEILAEEETPKPSKKEKKKDED